MALNTYNNVLTIWDSKKDPDMLNGIVYTWNGYIETEQIFSLFRYIEKNDHVFKKAYLEWIHELGEYRIADKRVIDHLVFKDGFSYWWMTNFVEKDAWKQPVIMDVLRLLALADILRQNRYIHLRLVTGNKSLRIAIASLCQSLKIQFEAVSDKVENKRISLNWYANVPVFIRSGLSMMRFLAERWRFRKTAPSQCYGKNAIFFCSYFFNLDKNSLAEGIFKSSYWGDIMLVLKEENLKANWLQIYYPHQHIPNAKAATKAIRTFNADRDKQGYHFFAESQLSVKSVLFVIQYYFWLIRKYMILKKLRVNILVNGISVDPWPLLKKDWKEAIIGPNAVFNLFIIDIHAKLFSRIPHQKKGIFLFENQSWDKVLIHYWRKFGHGTLIAVPHSTVRYWDFRYFTDPRILTDEGSGVMPFADIVAVNGSFAKESFCSTGFPENRVVECEALRYMGLNNILSKKKKIVQGQNHLKILLLGDYQPEGTVNLLRFTREALQLLTESVSVTIKPHPNHEVDPAKFGIAGLILTTESLENIIMDYDLVVSGNSTSASVDAYIAGLPVFVLLDDKELNFNPLRGCSGVYFIDSALSLKEAISGRFQHKMDRQATTFFHLDDALPRWRCIIA